MKNQDPKNKEKFPAYPHYDAKEDIFNKDAELIEEPDEILHSVPEKNEAVLNTSELIMELPVPENSLDIDDAMDDEEETEQNENDITDEEFELLDESDEEFDQDESSGGKRIYPVDFSGDDLDIPGAEDDDADEEIGEGDEENNLFSLPD